MTPVRTGFQTGFQIQYCLCDGQDQPPVGEVIPYTDLLNCYIQIMPVMIIYLRHKP